MKHEIINTIAGAIVACVFVTVAFGVMFMAVSGSLWVINAVVHS
jgi:hypothetical protein